MTTDIKNQDLLALKNYVLAGDATAYSSLPEGSLILDLSHSNLKQRHVEIRFDMHDTISHLRSKIHQKSGTPPDFQHLQIMRGGSVMFEIPPNTEDNRMLGYFSLSHGSNIHCIDLDPHSGSRGGGYEDVSLVEKYVMSEEDYNKRKGTVRDWGRKMKEKDPTFTYSKYAEEKKMLNEARLMAKRGLDLPEGFEFNANGDVVRSNKVNDSKATDEELEAIFGTDSVAGILVGTRCSVAPGDRRGEIAFVGLVPEIGPGYWVGVMFDEPVGKTDGTVKGGKRYFNAVGHKRGGFVRGKNIETGDFPEKDIMDELEDSDDDEL